MNALKKISIALVCQLGIAGLAYAQTSSSAAPGVTTQSAASPGATTAPAAPTFFQPQTSKRPSDDLIKQARRSGYIMKTRSSNYFFCKEEAELGTRLATERCVKSDDFALLLERQERDKDQIRQMSQALSGSGH